jgi:hypothetical protein
MQHLVEALASKKAWAVDLVAYWDRILFPDADKPHANDGGSAGDQRLEEEEDDNDFFGSAPAAVSPVRPVSFFFFFFVVLLTDCFSFRFVLTRPRTILPQTAMSR